MLECDQEVVCTWLPGNNDFSSRDLRALVRENSPKWEQRVQRPRVQRAAYSTELEQAGGGASGSGCAVGTACPCAPLLSQRTVAALSNTGNTLGTLFCN